jgi:hypothetical protein
MHASKNIVCGNETTENDMGWTCNKHEEYEEAI